MFQSRNRVLLTNWSIQMILDVRFAEINRVSPVRIGVAQLRYLIGRSSAVLRF